MKKISNLLLSEISNIFYCDILKLRGKFFIFCFNLLPDLYILRIVKNLLLRCAGVKLNIFKVYIRNGFHADSPHKIIIKSGFINKNCHFDGNGDIQIGEHCQIGPNVLFCTADHQDGDAFFPITVQNKVWIGAGSTILPGAYIDSSITIGAGSVLTRKKYLNVGGGDKYTIYCGNPARQLQNGKKNN